MIKFEFEEKVDAYCKSDRQWMREQRIQHAEYQKTLCKTDDERRFWNAVLKRNRD